MLIDGYLQGPKAAWYFVGAPCKNQRALGQESEKAALGFFVLPRLELPEVHFEFKPIPCSCWALPGVLIPLPRKRSPI